MCIKGPVDITIRILTSNMHEARRLSPFTGFSKSLLKATVAAAESTPISQYNEITATQFKMTSTLKAHWHRSSPPLSMPAGQTLRSVAAAAARPAPCAAARPRRRLLRPAPPGRWAALVVRAQHAAGAPSPMMQQRSMGGSHRLSRPPAKGAAARAQRQRRSRCGVCDSAA